MRIAIVGCGYVAAHYLETLHEHSNLTLMGVTDLDKSRAEALRKRFDVPIYDSTESLLADDEVELVVNLTDPESHYEVSKASLMAGKHVYSEKPLSVDLAEAKALVALAEETGLLISSAPCSILGETAQTLWKAVQDGAVGSPRLVYAELDDNPIYLMRPEGWANSVGTPWPYLNEYETGCTLEHAGYYLTWLAAMFGPAESVTAFSSCLVPDKTSVPLESPDTPDFSVACIMFESGVVARLTCSIVAPYDHRIRIIGNEGVLTADECWQFRSPVRLERFSQLSLNARKARSVRTSSFLQRLLGVAGKRQKLVRRPQRAPRRKTKRPRSSIARSLLRVIKKRQLVSMDFFRGVAEMASAIENDRRCHLPMDFVLHVNEMTLAIQDSRTTNAPYRLTTTFDPVSPLPDTLAAPQRYGQGKPGFLISQLDKLIARLHKQ